MIPTEKGGFSILSSAAVEIESEWTARKREQAAGKLCAGGGSAPLKPKEGLNGPQAATILRSGRDIEGMAYASLLVQDLHCLPGLRFHAAVLGGDCLPSLLV
jgi:hypothetical protein